jgi:GNAT superfamily N-acetyltransferase
MSGERFRVRPMAPEDIKGAVALQRACFPPPFPEELLWSKEHLERHTEVFPIGQFVALAQPNLVIGSASSCLVSEDTWHAHKSWSETVGGPFIERHDPHGTTLYGLDISVHPEWRRYGVGRALYEARFNLVNVLNLRRYGTGCRLPGYTKWAALNENQPVEVYCDQVASGKLTDRTLTPLLKFGLKFVGVVHDYMEDEESRNAAALLEWTA